MSHPLPDQVTPESAWFGHVRSDRISSRQPRKAKVRARVIPGQKWRRREAGVLRSYVLEAQRLAVGHGVDDLVLLKTCPTFINTQFLEHLLQPLPSSVRFGCGGPEVRDPDAFRGLHRNVHTRPLSARAHYLLAHLLVERHDFVVISFDHRNAHDRHPWLLSLADLRTIAHRTGAGNAPGVSTRRQRSRRSLSRRTSRSA